MVETQVWRACAAGAGARPAPTTAHKDGRGRWRPRLWAILNAQALIRGTAGGRGDVAFVEDDRGRLARRGR